MNLLSLELHRTFLARGGRIARRQQLPCTATAAVAIIARPVAEMAG